MASSPADTGDTTAVEPMRPNRAGRRLRLGMREGVRMLALLGLVLAGAQFLRFMRFVVSGEGGAVTRPEAADAFLPLGAAAALKVWLTGGPFDVLHPAATIILIAVLVTAWLFRRAMCSWLCPIGAASEHLASAGRRLFGRNLEVPRWLDRTLVGLKHAGTFAMMLWLCLVPNDEILAFMRMPFYAVADVKLLDFYLGLGGWAVVVLAVFVVSSMAVKSLWCRYLCPYGALQGWLGALSPMVLAKDAARCTGCGRCSGACPNGVDVARAHSAVVDAECIGCASCVEACRRHRALSLRLAGRAAVEPVAFGLAFVATFMGVIVTAIVTGHWESVLDAEAYYRIYHTSVGAQLPALPGGEGR